MSNIPTDDEREALVRKLEDEVEYRVRTAVALSKGGHDHNDQVRQGRASVRFLAAGFRRTVQGEPSDHGPDWSDWGIDHPEEGPSCKCGYNGTPEECAASRVQGEPTSSHDVRAQEWCAECAGPYPLDRWPGSQYGGHWDTFLAGFRCSGSQGEPSDAQVEAALAVLRSEKPGHRSQFSAMRAALRAAGGAR